MTALGFDWLAHGTLIAYQDADLVFTAREARFRVSRAHAAETDVDDRALVAFWQAHDGTLAG